MSAETTNTYLNVKYITNHDRTPLVTNMSQKI